MRQPRRGNVPGATASRETTRGNDVLAHATNRIRFSWYLLYNIPAEDRRQASGGADPYRRHITPYSSPGRATPQRPPTLGCLRGNTRVTAQGGFSVSGKELHAMPAESDWAD